MRLIASKLIWNFDLEHGYRSEEWNLGRLVYIVWKQKSLMLRLKLCDHTSSVIDGEAQHEFRDYSR
jgi:hypothetical protein